MQVQNPSTMIVPETAAVRPTYLTRKKVVRSTKERIGYFFLYNFQEILFLEIVLTNHKPTTYND